MKALIYYIFRACASTIQITKVIFMNFKFSFLTNIVLCFIISSLKDLLTDELFHTSQRHEYFFSNVYDTRPEWLVETHVFILPCQFSLWFRIAIWTWIGWYVWVWSITMVFVPFSEIPNTYMNITKMLKIC